MLYLSLKGMARVLFGHVNVEWAYLVTGDSPVGPGWFKVPEARGGPAARGWGLVPWTLGLLLTAGFCAFVYGNALRAVGRGRPGAFAFWAGGSALLLAALPLVWGDARFRAGVLPLVLLLWALSPAKRRR
jgi:hypothetical protein